MSMVAEVLDEFDELELEMMVIPSPAQIEAAAARIRRAWSPRQRRRRAQVARYMRLQQILACGRSIAAAAESARRFRPTVPSARWQ